MSDFSQLSHRIVPKERANWQPSQMDLSVKNRVGFSLKIEIIIFYTVVISSKCVFRVVTKIYFCANDVRLLQNDEKIFNYKRNLRTLSFYNYIRASRTSFT